MVLVALLPALLATSLRDQRSDEINLISAANTINRSCVQLTLARTEPRISIWPPGNPCVYFYELLNKNHNTFFSIHPIGPLERMFFQTYRDPL
jgi:hypothetical protein